MPVFGREKYVRKSYKPTVLAYLAGIVDGEGSLSIGSYSKSSIGTDQFTTYLCICNTNKDMIDWLVDNFGTKCIPYTNNQLSKNSRLPVWRWQITGDKLLHVCELILPYIVAKRRQVEIMIEMRKTFKERTYAKGQNGPRISEELIAHRHSLIKEIRSHHIRTSSVKH